MECGSLLGFYKVRVCPWLCWWASLTSDISECSQDEVVATTTNNINELESAEYAIHPTNRDETLIEAEEDKEDDTSN